MLIVKDIENPKRKSGYNHVNANKTASGYTYHGQAYARTLNEKQNALSQSNHIWWGKQRTSAEEAAQDYCDWFNTTGYESLTPEDLVNTKRQSGYDHVGSAMPGRGGHRATSIKWRARLNSGGGANPNNPSFTGVVRSDPRDAAQDYCDYMNGKLVASATPAPPARRKAIKRKLPKLKQVVHSSSAKPLVDRFAGMDEEDIQIIRTAEGLRKDAREDLPHYVYLVAETGTTNVKIGVAGEPEKRVGTLQTANPRPLVLVSKLKCESKAQAADLETKLHEKYLSANILREWFHVTLPMLRDFNIDTSDVEDSDATQEVKA